MSTNYYLHTTPCSCCGRDDPALHIGKSSGGWCFSLHVTEEITSLEDWKQEFKNGVIKDEYDRVLTHEEILAVITERSWPNRSFSGWPYKTASEFYEKNYAEPGPNNLLRHKLGGSCVGHGEGTWDLISSEFC